MPHHWPPCCWLCLCLLQDARNLNMTHCWVPTGSRTTRRVLFYRGKRYTAICAISVFGLVACHIVEGSANAEIFSEFLLLLVRMHGQ